MKKSRVDKLNKMLADLENRNLTTNKIDGIKMSLELLNADIEKRGRQDRFSKSQNLFKVEDELLENIGEQLEEEYNHINEVLQSDDRLKQDDISDQDYLDELDTEEDYITHSLESLGLSSEQIGDIWKIAKSKGMKKSEYESIIRNAISLEYNISFKENGYRNVNPDRLSRFIRDQFYNFKKE